MNQRTKVGPVLIAGDEANAIIAAIQDENENVTLLDHGAYMRVLVEGSCHVSRAAIERQIQGPFRLPRDLERVMTAFKGRIAITSEEARWDAPREE